MVENRGRRERAAFWKGAATFILILGVVCAILYNNVQLTELTSQIEKTRSQLEALENDYRLMQVKIESSTSLRTVQEIAETELGMAKAESYQVEYTTSAKETAWCLPAPTSRGSTTGFAMPGAVFWNTSASETIK